MSVVLHHWKNIYPKHKDVAMVATRYKKATRWNEEIMTFVHSVYNINFHQI